MGECCSSAMRDSFCVMPCENRECLCGQITDAHKREVARVETVTDVGGEKHLALLHHAAALEHVGQMRAVRRPENRAIGDAIDLQHAITVAHRITCDRGD